MITRHALIPAAYLVLIKDGKILLLRRFNTWFCDGMYSVIAGHVDPWETFTECIIREAKEEWNIDLIQENIKVWHVLNRKTQLKDNNERIDLYFIADNWNWEIKNMEPNKCDDLSWFDLDNLPENIIPDVKQAIESIKNNLIYSEFWWNK